jgi:thiol-disulfide isomerase/thioredoxin
MRRAAAALLLLLSQSALAVEAGAAAPVLAMPALNEPSRTVSLAQLKGQVVYVDFWASWCVPCRISFPALEALYKEHGAQGFVVIGVNKDVSAADAQRFLAKVPVTFTLVADGGDAAARGFDVKAMPSGYLIDRKGVVRKVHRGFTEETATELRREVDALMKEPS